MRHSSISFFVPGIPRPAGSKRAFPTKKGKIAIVDMSGAKGRHWRSAVQYNARQALDGRKPTAKPCRLWVDFYFPRPKSHYRTGKYAGELKPSAPREHVYRPDTTKLVRALEDALTGVVWWDDSQIFHQVATKSYVDQAHGEPGVWVQVVILDEEERRGR